MRKIHHTMLSVTRDGAQRTFAAELSCLRLAGFPDARDRVWPDACDAGVVVVGGRAEVTYAIESEEYDDEGDLEAYALVPTDDSKRRVPACAVTKLVLFND